MSDVGNIFVQFPVILKPHCFILRSILECMYKNNHFFNKTNHEFQKRDSVTSTTESYILPSILFSTAIHTQIPQIWEYPPPCRDRIVAKSARGGLPYERGGDARRNFWIKPLKETNLGVAQPFFNPPKAIILNFNYMNRVNKTNWKYIIF